MTACFSSNLLKSLHLLSLIIRINYKVMYSIKLCTKFSHDIPFQRSSIPLEGTYYRFDEELVVPIIENTPFEQDLEARLQSAPLWPLSRWKSGKNSHSHTHTHTERQRERDREREQIHTHARSRSGRSHIVPHFANRHVSICARRPPSSSV